MFEMKVVEKIKTHFIYVGKVIWKNQLDATITIY